MIKKCNVFYHLSFINLFPGALSQSQFPVFTIYAQKSCLAVKPCERAWCIDRVQGHRLQGHTRRTMNASSRQHCLELCLGERDFLCRWVSEQRLFFRFPRRESYSRKKKKKKKKEKALVFRRPGSFFPLAAAGHRYPPEKRSRGEKEEGGRTRDSTRIDTIFLSSPPPPPPPPPPRPLRESKATRSAAFSSYWVPRTWEEGREVTSRSYRVSSVSWSWGGPCFVRGKREISIELFTGRLFSPCYFYLKYFFMSDVFFTRFQGIRGTLLIVARLIMLASLEKKEREKGNEDGNRHNWNYIDEGKFLWKVIPICEIIARTGSRFSSAFIRE